ncbi:MAG TPA: cupin domain-containing protein [Thermomicrobiales bacterium]|nr:cupin domain-containing protein [Thermomicrobiales bacterium]
MRNLEENLDETRVAIVDADDANQFTWGSIQWLCNGKMAGDAEQTVGYVTIFAGANNPEHYHPNSDEVLYLIEGELDHSLDDEVFRLTPGTAIHIPRGVRHNAVNVSDVTARMVVSYPTPDRQTVFLDANDVGQE